MADICRWFKRYLNSGFAPGRYAWHVAAQHINPLLPTYTKNAPRKIRTSTAIAFNLNSAVGAKQSSGKLLMLNQCLRLESSTMANPFGEVR